ncbi:hypothetical protein ACH9EU_05745 [Kocuria sp. M1R5S2]|uniref:hypothetical protein n=1 Tax=Kocuria rhizosphaerae TaxID=3376285 RepID=UPI0037AC619D
MDERQMLNKDGATYVGARAVAVPARVGTTGARPTRQRVVGQDRDRFFLDDGHAYCRLTGVVWEQRSSPDRGTTRVRNAYTDGSDLFAGLWKSALEPERTTVRESARLRDEDVVAAVRADRRVPPWSRADFYYDIDRIRRAVDALEADCPGAGHDGFWAVVDAHRRPAEEIAGLTQPVGPECLTAGHGVCHECRPVHVWARIAEHRRTRHGGDPSARYDAEAIIAALDRIDPDVSRIPLEIVTRVLDAHCRPGDQPVA